MRKRTLNAKGLSLVEILLVIAIIGMMVLLIANLPNSISLISKSRHQGLAREIAVKAIEDIRAQQYINLTDGSSDLLDSRVGLLPEGAGTKIISDCSVDVCANGEQAKQVTISISWKETGRAQNLTVTTLIGQGGLGQ